MTFQSVDQILDKARDPAGLTETEIQSALDRMMSGAAMPDQMKAFLLALRERGETVEEITGAAALLRSRMLPVHAPADAVDIVGTGGDSHGTYNVSTAAALVAAGAGLKVAKHGNRSVSSLSGASDVLAKLGVKLDVSPETVTRAINEAGVGFMWAPMHHPAMKIWAPIRAELKMRTIFNVLGPLCNPANVTRQVVGVYDRKLVEPIAETLKKLGSVHAMVVHGSDGLDEFTTTGPTTVAELNSGDIAVYEVLPEDAGLPRATLAQLKGGDAAVNADAIRRLLEGEKGPYRDIVLLNTAAALIVGGKVTCLDQGVDRAAHAIDTGAAKSALEKLVAVTNSSE